jgi:hypothetical protein
MGAGEPMKLERGDDVMFPRVALVIVFNVCQPIQVIGGQPQ